MDLVCVYKQPTSQSVSQEPLHKQNSHQRKNKHNSQCDTHANKSQKLNLAKVHTSSAKMNECLASITQQSNRARAEFPLHDHSNIDVNLALAKEQNCHKFVGVCLKIQIDFRLIKHLLPGNQGLVVMMMTMIWCMLPWPGTKRMLFNVTTMNVGLVVCLFN